QAIGAGAPCDARRRFHTAVSPEGREAAARLRIRPAIAEKPSSRVAKRDDSDPGSITLFKLDRRRPLACLRAKPHHLILVIKFSLSASNIFFLTLLSAA